MGMYTSGLSGRLACVQATGLGMSADSSLGLVVPGKSQRVNQRGVMGI